MAHKKSSIYLITKNSIVEPNDTDEKENLDEDKTCFLYDTQSPPSCTEKIFGESHHVKDEYTQHQISAGFILTVISVYTVQGARDALNIAFFYYFQAIFNFGPSELQQFQSYITIPWTIKMFYGLMIDTLPICGYKRKPYILIFGMLGPITVLITIIYGHHSYSVQLIFMIINSICTAFCDVIAVKYFLFHSLIHSLSKIQEL